MSKNIASKIKLNNFDSLFGSQELQSGIVNIAISELHGFKNHPFKVIDDEKMEDMVESIREHGVLVPLIVRKTDTGYEIIAGHRRKHACEKIGINNIPVIIKELTDDEAIIMMVDSNIQREEILPSEKAFSYKMKLEAIKRQGLRTDLTSSQVGTKLKRSDEILAEETGESRNQIQRYIRLTYLITDFLDMVDSKKLPLNTAAELSFLKKKEQKMILVAIKTYGIPSLKQAMKLKEYSKEKMLDENVINIVMTSESNDKISVNLNHKTLSRFFPENYTSRQMRDIIIQLLKEWQKNEKGLSH